MHPDLRYLLRDRDTLPLSYLRRKTRAFGNVRDGRRLRALLVPGGAKRW